MGGLGIIEPMRRKTIRPKDSWGGRALFLLAAGAVLSAAASRVLDHTIQYEDLSGRRYLESGGNVSQYVTLGMSGLAIVCAVIGIAYGYTSRNGRLAISGVYPASIFWLVTFWALAMSLFRGEASSISKAAEVALALVVTTSIFFSPPTLRTLSNISHLLFFTAIGAIAFDLYGEGTPLACRVDKCGIFDNMLTGFWYQENGAARVMLLMLPAVMAIKSKFYSLLIIGATLVFMLGTASRSSLVGFGVAVVLIWMGRRRIWGDRNPRRLALALRILPLAAYGVSAYLLFNSTIEALTGRGEIYAGIRSAAKGMEAIFGSGSGTVQNLSLGYNALAFGEHGQAPHLLVQAGAVGMLLFAVAMIAVVAKTKWTPLQFAGYALLAVSSTQFITEPSWELSPKTTAFAMMILSAGLIARHYPSNAVPKSEAADIPQKTTR